MEGLISLKMEKNQNLEAQIPTRKEMKDYFMVFNYLILHQIIKNISWQ